MFENQVFANLQVRCNNRRIVAKKIYNFLLKGYRTSATDTLFGQFDSLSKILGCAGSLNCEAKQSISKLFNMASSPSYFLRKHDDGWTSVLHERFSVTNIVSYALQYSKSVPEHAVIALGYDGKHFLCDVFQEGKAIFSYSVCQETQSNAKPNEKEIESFAKIVNSSPEEVWQMINADFCDQLENASRIFKHPIKMSLESITSAERSLYIEVSGDGVI